MTYRPASSDYPYAGLTGGQRYIKRQRHLSKMRLLRLLRVPPEPVKNNILHARREQWDEALADLRFAAQVQGAKPR